MDLAKELRHEGGQRSSHQRAHLSCSESDHTRNAREGKLERKIVQVVIFHTLNFIVSLIFDSERSDNDDNLTHNALCGYSR